MSCSKLKNFDVIFEVNFEKMRVGLFDKILFHIFLLWETFLVTSNTYMLLS